MWEKNESCHIWLSSTFRKKIGQAVDQTNDLLLSVTIPYLPPELYVLSDLCQPAQSNQVDNSQNILLMVNFVHVRFPF